MVFSRFRVVAAIRVLLLVLTIVVAVGAFFRHPPMITAGLLIILVAVVQVIGLIRYVELVAREMDRFLLAIRTEDFTQSFQHIGLGKSFDQLGKSLKEAGDQFRNIRAEREGHYHYLQTVIRQVGTGLISFNENGDVKLMNNTAKRLLGVQRLRNIAQLSDVDPALVSLFQRLKPGDRYLFQVQHENLPVRLSLYATSFTLRDEVFTMVSVQDIGSELDNERMRKELELAHQVQSRLFPEQKFKVEGVDLAGHCIPARETGGDYYDWFTGNSHALTLVIGDVSGKGMAAAFYMTLCKGFFQSLAESKLSPAATMAQVNQMLSGVMEKNRFVSIFLGQYDSRSGHFTYARAGHNPPILLTADSEEPRFLQARGLALGLETGQRFREAQMQESVDLRVGDLLVCYTDGITEAMDREGNQYGLERMIDVVQARRKDSAQDIMDAIFQDVLTFTAGTPQMDDMTLLILKPGAS